MLIKSNRMRSLPSQHFLLPKTWIIWTLIFLPAQRNVSSFQADKFPAANRESEQGAVFENAAVRMRSRWAFLTTHDFINILRASFVMSSLIAKSLPGAQKYQFISPRSLRQDDPV